MKRLIFICLVALCAVSAVGQTVDEVRREIRRQGLPCGEIVLAQARLESGNFTSRLARTKNNILGMTRGKGYATYKRWQDCIADYKARVSSRYKGGDYYQFLVRIGYAQDGERYVKALKGF